MIYGQPAINIDEDSTDRIGIRRLVMSQMWQPTTWPLSEAEYQAQEPGIPSAPGGVVLIGRDAHRERGTMRTRWTFEGVDGDGKSVTFKTRANTIDYGFEPGFSQVDIRLLPNFQTLKEQYGGQDDGLNLTWPATIPSSTGGTGLSTGSNAGQTNPMFGQQDYLRMEGIYRCRYAAVTIAGIYDLVGTIFEGGLPGVAPTIAGRNWLYAPPTYQWRGTVFEITEYYWLSGPGGWPQPVYGKIPVSASSGLVTGGLSIGGV